VCVRVCVCVCLPVGCYKAAVVAYSPLAEADCTVDTCACVCVCTYVRMCVRMCACVCLCGFSVPVCVHFYILARVRVSVFFQ
jgi:hypothetical protein